MAQRSLSEQISLAIQNKVYEVADKVTTVVDEALEAFEDAAKVVEDKATPVYNINLNNDLDPKVVAKRLLDEINKGRAQHGPYATGGRVKEVPSLQDTLSVVYDYMEGEGLLSEESFGGLGKDRVLGSYKAVLSKMYAEQVRRMAVGGNKTYKLSD